ncbi:hypothetical protein GW17_00008913 [Ensete ventricosum]|nr:hypothetical protein GW17_00008913 [Ensete ventricosum]
MRGLRCTCIRGNPVAHRAHRTVAFDDTHYKHREVHVRSLSLFWWRAWACLSESTVHRVGNTAGWNVGFNYSKWSSPKIICQVGDVIGWFDGCLPPCHEECIIVAMITTTLLLVAGLVYSTGEDTTIKVYRLSVRFFICGRAKTARPVRRSGSVLVAAAIGSSYRSSVPSSQREPGRAARRMVFGARCCCLRHRLLSRGVKV